jgi:hypothetical protein
MAAFLDHSVLVTVSTAGEQVIHSRTVAGTNLNMKLLTLGAAYTTYNATEAYIGFGRFQFDTGGGWETKDRSPAFVNTDLDNNNPLIIRPLGSGQVLAVGHSIRAICNPATATSIRWTASIWGEN